MRDSLEEANKNLNPGVPPDRPDHTRYGIPPETYGGMNGGSVAEFPGGFVGPYGGYRPVRTALPTGLTRMQFLDLPDMVKIRKNIRSSAVLSFVCAAITLIFLLMTQSYAALIDVAVMIGCGVFILKMASRAASIVLLAYGVFNFFYSLLATGTPGGWLIVMSGVYAVIYTVKLDKEYKSYKNETTGGVYTMNGNENENGMNGSGSFYSYDSKKEDVENTAETVNGKELNESAGADGLAGVGGAMDPSQAQNGMGGGFGTNSDAFGQNGFTQGGYGNNGMNQLYMPNGMSGQNAYEQNPYGQNPYSQNTYGQNGFGQNTYGQNDFGQNGYGQNNNGQNGFGPNTYGQNTYGKNAYGTEQGNSQSSNDPNGTTGNYGTSGDYGASGNYGTTGNYGASGNYGTTGSYGTGGSYGQVPGRGGFTSDNNYNQPGPGGFIPNGNNYQPGPGGFNPNGGQKPKKNHGLLIVLIIIGVAALLTLLLVFLPSCNGGGTSQTTSSSSSELKSKRGKVVTKGADQKDSKSSKKKSDISGKYSNGSKKGGSTSGADLGSYESHMDEIVAAWECRTDDGGKVVFYTNEDGTYCGFIDIYYPEGEGKTYAAEWAIGNTEKDDNVYTITDEEGNDYQVVAVGADTGDDEITFAIMDFDKDKALADESVVTMKSLKLDDSFRKLLQTMDKIAGH
uniref:hypothetical protein n=1 Tax=Eubacterium cellulosolvens TaxID=29322 RepID=UPI0004893DCB|nr:hypothetical protein [[Eubacterium] cellulosolvens]